MVVNVSIIGMCCATLIVATFTSIAAGHWGEALFPMIVASVLGCWEWRCISRPMSYAHAAMVLVSGLFAVFSWLAAILAGLPSISFASSWAELSGWLGIYSLAVMSTFVFIAHAKWTDCAKPDASDASAE
jgi:hypothetical protein